MRWLIEPEVPPTSRVALLDPLARNVMKHPLVQQYAAMLTRAGAERSLAQPVLRLVHVLPLRADSTADEAFQGAHQTIARAGDCEAPATLLVVFARRVGLREDHLPQPTDPPRRGQSRLRAGVHRGRLARRREIDGRSATRRERGDRGRAAAAAG